MLRVSVLSFHDHVHVQLYHEILLSNTWKPHRGVAKIENYLLDDLHPGRGFERKEFPLKSVGRRITSNALSFYNWRTSPNIVFGIGRLYLERIHGATTYLCVRALLLCAPRSWERQKPVGEMQSASHWLLLQAGRWSFRTETFTFWLSWLWSRALTSPLRSSTEIVWRDSQQLKTSEPSPQIPCKRDQLKNNYFISLNELFMGHFTGCNITGCHLTVKHVNISWGFPQWVRIKKWWLQL